MPCDHRQTTTAKPNHIQMPPEPEHLPCPRCDSTNTKFCYYNFSQPRHFCKACRRYWTHGGTLRDIPIGGGTRKTAKRSRLISHNNSSSLEFRHMAPPTATPVLLPFAGENGGGLHFLGDVGASMGESFTSLLNSTQGPGGFFGLGVGGFEDVNFGMGRAIWPFSGVGDGGHHAAVGGGTTWQVEGGEVFYSARSRYFHPRNDMKDELGQLSN